MKIVAGASCAASPATIPITSSASTVSASVCVDATASEKVCSATYPIKSTNAAALAAAITVNSRTVTAPFTNVLDIVAFPATLTASVTSLSNGVPASLTQNGGTGAGVKIADVVFGIPAGLPAGTTFSFDVDAVTGEISTAGAGATDCNDLNVSQVSNGPGAVTLAFATPSAPPTISVSRNNATVADNGATITYTITASSAPTSNLVVNLNSGVTGIGGALTGGTTCGGTITILANANTATCTLGASNTVPFDGPGTATVTVASGAGYNVAAAPNNTASASITNDDLPTVTVTPTGPTNLPDNGASQTVTVTLNATAPTGGFVVPLTAPAANARLGGTCIGLTSITVPAAQSSASCTVIAVTNTIAGDGTVAANVAANCTSTCTNGTPATAQLNVTDDDVPVINVACAAASIVDSSGAAGTTTCTFRNTLAVGATGFNVAFTQSADARYTISGCTSPLTVAANTVANSVIGTCTVTATANTVPGDGSVTATFNVTAGTGYSAGAAGSVAINDDDKATVSVAINGATSVAEGDAGAGSPLTFRFTSSVASLAATTVKFSLPASARYTVGGTTGCTAGSVVLAASQTTFDCTVTPIGNTAPDGNVTVTVSVTADAAYNVGGSSAVGTITDDDAAVNAVAGSTGAATATSTPEGTVVRFSVSCPTLAASQTINFAITPATAYTGDVYSGSPTGSVTCPAAAASLVAVPTTVQSINDVTVGNTRVYTMTISVPAPIGASLDTLKASGPSVAATIVGNATATVTVTDDDQPVSIPTMGVLSLGLMSLLIAGFAGFQRRRVQK